MRFKKALARCFIDFVVVGKTRIFALRFHCKWLSWIWHKTSSGRI